MAADSWSSADSRAFSPLCTASVATCRIRSAVAGDAAISFIQAPADQVYPVMPDGQPVGKFHPINYISELVALNRTLQSITPALCRYCCKSRKSNNPKNLAKVDLWASLRLRP